MILHLVGFSCSTFTLRVWIPCLQILSCVAFLAWMCHLVEGDLKDSLPSGICSGCHPWFKCLETELKKKLQKKEEHFLDFLSAIPATSPYPFELDVCRIHLEEYHEPVFCTFNSFYYSVYCNLLCTHLKHWRLRGRKSKKPGYIFCSILIVFSSNTVWPLIYLKM